jgi:PST family polysaccharide transporter
MLDQLLQQVMRLALTVVLTRLTEPEDYGLIGIAFVVTAVSSFITDLGMGSALIQRRKITNAHVSTALACTAALGFAFAALVIATSHPVASFFREPRLAAVLVVMSLNFPLKGLSAVPRDLLRRQLLFRPLTVANGIAVLISGTAAVVIAALGGGVWALVVYSVGESVVALVTLWAAALSRRLASIRLTFHRTEFRELIGFSASVTGFKLLYYVQISIDNLIVGRVLGPEALGYYGLAYRLMLYPIQRVGDVLANVALPAFATLQDDRARLRTAFRRGMSTISLVCFPLSMMIMVSAPLLIPVALGQKWAPSIATVQILALNGPRIALNRLNGSVFQAVGRPAWDMWLALLALCAYVVAFTIGVRHGITGMAIAYTVAGYLTTPAAQIMVGRALRTSSLGTLGGLTPLLIPTVAMVVAGEGTRRLVEGHGPTWIQLIAVVSACGVTYLALVLATARSLLSEFTAALRGR